MIFLLLGARDSVIDLWHITCVFKETQISE